MLPNEIENKRILIAPLDWGLGHTTRCIPLIQLLSKKNSVVFAGTDTQIKLVSQDFPDIEYEKIAGYHVNLNSQKPTYIQIFVQLFAIHKAIAKEGKIATDLCKKHSIDVVISDNRYGFKVDACLNILLTHQLSPPIPYFRKLVQKKIISWVNKFDFCWIPDDEARPLCKALYDQPIKIPKLLIGWLSRFKANSVLNEFDFLLITSGPNPERVTFKNEIIKVLKKGNLKFAVADIEEDTLQCQYYFKNPSTAELGKLLDTSKTVITRAGYTSIMELACLDKTSILIPTQGQYEQEYLAQVVENPNFTFCSTQEFIENIS